MERIPCFVYQPGRHFVLPPALARLPPRLSEFAVSDALGAPRPHPQVFQEAASPEEARVFLFPFNIGQYLDTGPHIESVSAVIESLPYLAGRENRHLVCDNGDKTRCLPQGVCLFKTSLLRPFTERAVPLWYNPPAHVLADRADFSWGNIRYDCSFVGKITSLVRRAAIASIEKQAGALRFFRDIDPGFRVENNYFFVDEGDEALLEQRREIFRKSIKESLTVLCPPGVGPQSIRMYEVMYLGRIPVIFGNEIVYPLERQVDYEAFCLRIPLERVMDTGSILQGWLAGRRREELYARGVLACKTWHKYFSPAQTLPTLLREAEALFGF
jgi:hypothetical protein